MTTAMAPSDIRFQKFEKKGSPFLNDFDKEIGICLQTFLAANSSIQIALQRLRNEIAQETPSTIQTVKQIFVSIGFGLNTLFGLVETAARVTLFILPFLIALAVDWVTAAEDLSLVDKILKIIGGCMIVPLLYTVQSGISTVTNLQTPTQSISYKGQMGSIFRNDHTEF